METSFVQVYPSTMIHINSLLKKIISLQLVINKLSLPFFLPFFFKYAVNILISIWPPLIDILRSSSLQPLPIHSRTSLTLSKLFFFLVIISVHRKRGRPLVILQRKRLHFKMVLVHLYFLYLVKWPTQYHHHYFSYDLYFCFPCLTIFNCYAQYLRFVSVSLTTY